jgi:chromosome segregation ATPase
VPERTRWTDDRLEDHMRALSALPQSVATLAVTIDQAKGEATSATAAIEKLREDQSERDRRLHERIDDVLAKLNDDRREYRRNIILALGPLAAVALVIVARAAGLAVPGL